MSCGIEQNLVGGGVFSSVTVTVTARKEEVSCGGQLPIYHMSFLADENLVTASSGGPGAITVVLLRTAVLWPVWHLL